MRASCLIRKPRHAVTFSLPSSLNQSCSLGITVVGVAACQEGRARPCMNLSSCWRVWQLCAQALERLADCKLLKPCGTAAYQCPREPHLLTVCGFCGCSSSSSVWHFSSCPTEYLPHCISATPGCCYLHGVRVPPQMTFPPIPSSHALI